MPDYLKLLQGDDQPAERPANPYLSALESEEQGRQRQFRATVETAVNANPDQVSAQRRTAGYLGYPQAAVEALPQETERQAKVKRVDEDTANAPMLRQRFTDADFAKLAHDDTGNLSSIEALFGALKAGAKYVVSAPDSQKTLGGDIKAGALRASGGAAGAFRAGAETVAPVLDPLERFSSIGGNPLRRLAEGFGMIAKGNERAAREASPDIGNMVVDSISSGVQSAVGNILALPLALTPGGQPAALTLMSAQAGGQSYQKAREQGIGQTQALVYGASDALVEAATEMIPLSRLIGDVKAGSGVLKTLGKQMALEVPGEQIATILQDANEWATLNPEKSAAQYLAERPEAAVRTLIATLVGVGGNVAVTSTMQSVMDRAAGHDRRAQAAESAAAGMDQIAKVAEASKLRERDPESFKAFTDELVRDDVPNLYVDAQALMQSGVDLEALAQAVPSVAEQIQQAAATGGDLVIPTAELLAAKSAPALKQSLIEHARTAPDAMSRAEAQAFMKDQGDQIKAEIEQEMTRREQDQTWQMQRDEVAKEFQRQLDEVGRFAPEVNKQYAALLGSFYATQAERAGTTAQELAAKYPLRISDKAPAVGGAGYVAGPVEDSAGKKVPGLTKTFDNGRGGQGVINLAIKGGALVPVWVDNGVYDRRLNGSGGKVVAEYESAIKEATARGLQFASDNSVTIEAARIYDSLKRRGYDVQRNPTARLAEKPEVLTPRWLTADGTPVFTVATSGGAAGVLYQAKPMQTDTPEFKAWFGASKVVDADGKPLVVYHGTRNEFTTFDYSKIGDNGRAEGAGFYFTNSEEVASGYGDLLRVFLSIKKPLAYDAKGFSKSVVQKIVRRVAEREAEAEGGDIADGFLSNFGDVRSEGLGSVVRQAADIIADDPTAVDQLSGIVGSGVNAEHVNRATFDVTGHDGVVANGFANSGDADNRIFVAFFPEQIKSADRNRGTFDPNSPNILEQFAGVNAKTANVNELTNARRRLAMGDDAETVRKETGWSKGVDGRWRFEISDADAKLKPALASLETGGYEAKQIASITYRKVGDAYDVTLNPVNPQKTSDFVTLKQVSKDVLDAVLPDDARKAIDRGDGDADYIGNFEDAKRIDVAFPFEGFNALPLSQAIDHPALFAAYPKLADVMVQVQPRLGRGGSFALMQDGQWVIRIGRGDQLSTLLHEIQHGIQEVEGFARGGSQNQFTGLEAPAQAKLDAINARLNSGEYDMSEYDSLLRQKRDILNTASPETSASMYKRLAGEVEARNTQARAAMTDVERAATAPSKTADVADADVIVTFNGKEMASAPPPENIDSPAPRGQLTFGADITQIPSVMSIFDKADLSTVAHESAHFFLEVQADLAARIDAQIREGASVTDGERQILSDMTTALDWMGIKDMPEASALTQWLAMPLDEKRSMHEQFARGWEAYAFEGKSPSLELRGVFQRFGAWLKQIYRSIKNLNVTLTDEVRGVFDRMIATEDQIREAEQVRAMGPLFTDQGGMTPEQWQRYQQAGERATQEAVDKLQERALRDMKWLSNAKSKRMKGIQAQADDLRREVRMEVQREVMSQPVYRAWRFLTGKGDSIDTVKASKDRASKGVDPERDSLFVAIAKNGGLRKEEITKAWGVDPKEKLQSGVFGKPVLRVEGGISIDAMLERLAEDGHVLPGEDGRLYPQALEELFDAERRGNPVYSVRRDYSDVFDAPADGLPDHVTHGKLNTDALRDQYGTREDALWRKLSDRNMTSPSGIMPDVVAETMGFDSGDAMVRALAEARDPKAVISELTDQRMLEQHGDLGTPEGVERATNEALANDVRTRFLATEIKALEDATSVRETTGVNAKGQRQTVDVMARAAKVYAEDLIGRMQIKDIRPSRFEAAATRAAKMSMKAFKAGNTAEAAAHKRSELIQLSASRAAHDAVEEIGVAQRYMRKFDKRSKTLDAEYQDQIEALLERFDFRPISLKEIGRRKSLQQWYDEQVERGITPNIPDELLADAGRKSYKEMTPEELRGLVETVKQIEHLGRLKNRLLLAKDQREFDAAATEMAASIIANGGAARPEQIEGPAPVVDWFAGVAAQHRKLTSLFRQFDGGQDDGPMWDLVGRAMNERSTMEDVALEKATGELAKLYEPLTKLRGGITGFQSKLFIPEIDASLTRGGRLAVALNWGNEQNRQRVMSGDNWTESQVRAILKTLTPVELEFVNKTWEFLDSYWPEVSAKEKRLTGVEPEKVEAQPFTVTASDGSVVQMRGGYYPIAYDANRSNRADSQEAMQAAKEMMQGATTRAITRRGHTKTRLEEVKRPVRKDLNVITQHVTQVVHDLAWHEWLIDTNRLMSDDRVVDAIRSHYGPKVLKTIKNNILGIATGDTVAQTEIDKAMLLLRSNVTRATMGASVTTAFLQAFGLTQSVVRLGGNKGPVEGARWMLRGLARWGGDAARMENAMALIHEKSDFMRLRAKTFNRELREIRGTVAGKSKTMRVVDAGLFVMMQKMQMVADVPTWIGQYEKSIAQGLDEDAAIAQADRAVVESQGGGASKDLAEVQRKHPMLTQFYSYFSVTLNLAAERTAATNFKNPAAVAGWLGDMALLMVIPAIIPAFIMAAIKGGGDDDDLLKNVAQWQLSYLLGSVVGLRELSGAVSGYDYAGPPVARLIGDVSKVSKQAAQGEVDEAAVLSTISLMGTAFGIPTTQIVRSYRGWKAWDEGEEGAGAQSVLFGPPSND